MSQDAEPIPSVLFVCLGNICRSPMAEGALRAMSEKTGLKVRIDSAGIGDYHVGDAPDLRAIEIARRDGVDISHQRARQVKPRDFHEFTHVFAMDTANIAGINGRAPRDGTAKIALMLDAVEGRQGQSIKDPYYGEAKDFDKAWTEILIAVNAIHNELKTYGVNATF